MFRYEQSGRAAYESMSRGDLIEELCRRDIAPDAKAIADASTLAAKVATLEGRLLTLAATQDETVRMFEHAPAAYCTHDRNGTIHTANAAARALFCASVLDGQSLFELVTTVEPRTLEEHIRRTVDEGRRFTMELAVSIRARGRVTLRFTSALLDDTRRAKWMCGTILEDVTRVKADETRLHALLRLHDALACAPDENAALDTIAASCVPFLGDACIIELRTDDASTLQRVRTKVTEEAAELKHHVESDASDAVWRRQTSRAIETHTPVFEPSYPPFDTANGPNALIGAPLVAHGRALGVLAVISAVSNLPYTLRHVETAMWVADRAALALSNLRRSRR